MIECKSTHLKNLLRLIRASIWKHYEATRYKDTDPRNPIIYSALVYCEELFDLMDQKFDREYSFPTAPNKIRIR